MKLNFISVKSWSVDTNLQYKIFITKTHRSFLILLLLLLLLLLLVILVLVSFYQVYVQEIGTFCFHLLPGSHSTQRWLVCVEVALHSVVGIYSAWPQELWLHQQVPPPPQASLQKGALISLSLVG